MTEREQLEQAIAALEAQRAILGDSVVDAMVAAARKELAALGPSSAELTHAAKTEASAEDSTTLSPHDTAVEQERTPGPAPATALQGARKLVTVMFSDISGFTALTETMDPETVRDLMNACFEQLVPIIEKYEGTVDKFMGDAIMVLFGAPVAHENDPERALRSALEMMDALAAFNAEQGIDLGLHIGINTGMVIAGGIGTPERQQYSVMGDAVNVASRLEDISERGEILVGLETYRLTAPLFEFETLEPIQIKGKMQPIQVYKVHRAKPRAFRVSTRGMKDIETRMVGRDTELAYLQDMLYKAMSGERQMVTITGEAGVGKSRLLYEFENWMELPREQIYYFKGRASPEMQNVPYALIRDLFSFRFQIKDSDPASVMRTKMERGIAEVFRRDEWGHAEPHQRPPHSRPLMRAHFIGQLLGFDFSDSPYLQGALNDAQQIRNRALIGLSKFFQATTELAPTVIFLEDIHWADDSSLDVIRHLARTAADQCLLIVCLARPTLFERRPHWCPPPLPLTPSPSPLAVGQSDGTSAPTEQWRGGEDGSAAAGGELEGHTRLELPPLSEQDSRTLVDEVLQKVEEVPATLRELVVSRSEGNPFYVEELIKMLIEDGVIVKGEEHWYVEPDRLTTARVPPTLTGVLQARLDSLPQEERTLLQRASVVGRIFWDSTVVQIGKHLPGEQWPNRRISGSAYQEGDAEGVANGLAALQDKEMVFRRRTSTFAEAQEYIFKHAILREVTYESVLKRVRRVYHGLVAEWLIEHSGERASEVTGLIAEHLELAGQTKQALPYLRRAGEQAAAQFANAEAVKYFSRALALIPEDAASERSAQRMAERYALLLSRERVYDLQGAREAQLQDLTRLEGLADALDEADPRAGRSRRAEIALRQANYARVTGDYPQAITSTMAAIAAAQATEDVYAEAAGRLQWGLALWRLGDFGPCRAQLEQALARARVVGSRQLEADSLRILGNVYYYQSDYAQATAHWKEALLISREIGERAGEASALSNLGEAARSQGDYAGARAYYEQRLNICREIGERHGESIALLNVGLVSHNLGDNKASREYSQQALRLAQETGNRSHQAYASTNLGHALVGLECLAEATDAYRRALALRRELGEHHLAMETIAGLAHVSLIQGDLPQAQAFAEEILSYLKTNTLEGTEEPLRVYLTCYRVLRAGQDPRARDVLATAYTLLQERAAIIPDEELRRSFLKNVAAHREIVREWETHFWRSIGDEDVYYLHHTSRQVGGKNSGSIARD